MIGFPDAPFNFVSAGETLELQRAGATFSDIPIEGSGSFRGNGTDLAPYPIDGDLTLQVPGEVFPAFANVAMPAPKQVQGFTPSGRDSIEASTRFSWMPGAGHNGTLFFAVVGFVDGGFVEFKCRPIDDGEFELPADLKAMLNAALLADWSIEGVEVRAETVTVVSANNALLVATRRIE